MSEVTLTKANFEEEVINSDKTVLVDFWASWCGPCKMIAPVIAELAEKHPEIKVGKVNVDEQMQLAQVYGVTSIPMILVFKNGQITGQQIGFTTLQVLEALIG